jgi:flagellar biosynthesis protein FlhB
MHPLTFHRINEIYRCVNHIYQIQQYIEFEKKKLKLIIFKTLFYKLWSNKNDNQCEQIKMYRIVNHFYLICRRGLINKEIFKQLLNLLKLLFIYHTEIVM